MVLSNTQTLILTFTTNKQNTIRVLINNPKANLNSSDIKTVMQDLISLASITNGKEELITTIKGAAINNKLVETISF